MNGIQRRIDALRLLGYYGEVDSRGYPRCDFPEAQRALVLRQRELMDTPAAQWPAERGEITYAGGPAAVHIRPAAVSTGTEDFPGQAGRWPPLPGPWAIRGCAAFVAALYTVIIWHFLAPLGPGGVAGAGSLTALIAVSAWLVQHVWTVPAAQSEAELERILAWLARRAGPGRRW